MITLQVGLSCSDNLYILYKLIFLLFVFSALYLSNVDQIRAFRHRHWNFTKSYIIKHTQHAVATGGSPITTWLPNQLGTVLDQMIEVGNTINRNNLTEENQMALDAIWKRAEAQKRVLDREVATLKKAYKDQDKV